MSSPRTVFGGSPRKSSSNGWESETSGEGTHGGRLLPSATTLHSTGELGETGRSKQSYSSQGTRKLELGSNSDLILSWWLQEALAPQPLELESHKGWSSGHPGGGKALAVDGLWGLETCILIREQGPGRSAVPYSHPCQPWLPLHFLGLLRANTVPGRVQRTRDSPFPDRGPSAAFKERHRAWLRSECQLWHFWSGNLGQVI